MMAVAEGLSADEARVVVEFLQRMTDALEHLDERRAESN
jgi:hypothetical protein